MLPATARLRHRADFTRVVRSGRRVGRGALVVHVAGAGIGRGPGASSHTRLNRPAGVRDADTGRPASVAGPGPEVSAPAASASVADPGGDEAVVVSRPARAGFVVSKAVGPAVTRNLVTRRLRHLLRERLPQLPDGADLVVRALPAAATRSYDGLAGDLDAALAKAMARPERSAAPR